MIERIDFQRYAQGENHPPVEDITAFISEMTELVHSIGKGVRRTQRFPGVDFIMPPALQDWRPEGKDGHSELLRDTQISMRVVDLGGAAWRMQAIHTDTVRVGGTYDTARDFYWFMWRRDEAFEAQRVRLTMKSDATSILAAPPQADVLQMNIGATERHVSTDMVSAPDFDILRRTADEYGKGLMVKVLANSTTL